MIQLWPFHGGIEPKSYKTLSNQVAIKKAGIPQFLTLPLLQHIGEPTKPVVNIADKVLKGQIIAHCENEDCSLSLSAPIHASSSGTIVAIESHAVPHPSGLNAPCIVIATDGNDEWIERFPLPNYTDIEPDIVRNYIAQAGIVGLGGAGFPSHVKLVHNNIDTLIINGAECEPYITCDDRIMQEHPADVIVGAQILLHVLGGAKNCIIAVENNKPQAYKTLSNLAQGNIAVVQVPTLYPMGGERQLIYTLTGKEVGRGKLPASIGIVVHNVETTRAIYRAIYQGRPLISRAVTVTGTGLETPQNFEILLGTPMEFILKQCNPKSNLKRLIMGGPMMGFSLPNNKMPIVKTTNCLILSDKEEVKPLQMPCIRCGACAQACPINLLPQQLYWYAKAKDLKKIQEYHLFDCIDCGCCAYVCPSHIPLISYYRYAKAEIRANEQESKKSESAKHRHEFRTFRLERIKAEKKARLQKLKSKSNASKESAIKAALERVKAKKQAIIIQHLIDNSSDSHLQ